MNSASHHRLTTFLAALALGLGVVACGDDSDEDDSTQAANSSTPAAVSVESIDGFGDVLVDSDGAVLYTADQEMDGTVRCTQSCAEIWLPLALPRGGEPSGSDDVSSALGVTERPDGERQVTFEGQPLYRFADDGGPGQVTGDGLADTFDGERFSWRVATAEGVAGDSGDASSPSPY
jgi:predicted lipoprotein with Yx(FWY)xxD motif